MYSLNSQLQTYMTLRIEGCTGKHSACTCKHPATNSRIEAQRMAANTPAGEVEKLLLSCVFHLLLSATEEKERLICIFSLVIHCGQI